MIALFALDLCKFCSVKNYILLSLFVFIGLNAFSQTQKHGGKTKAPDANKKPAQRQTVVAKPKEATPIAALAPKDTTPVVKADPVNLNYKGPYGEPIYTDPSGKLYYIDKNDKHVYIDLSN